MASDSIWRPTSSLGRGSGAWIKRLAARRLYIWQQDSAPCHISRRTQFSQSENFCNHIASNIWLPNLLLCKSYPSYYNGLFSPLLVQRYEQYETSYLFYVTLSFLCNIICYLISVFVFSLVTLSGATTLTFPLITVCGMWLNEKPPKLYVTQKDNHSIY